MKTKIELLEAVYRAKNKIAEVTGEKMLDIENLTKSFRFFREVENSKMYELKERLETLERQYKDTIEKNERDLKRDAYYATPEGAEHKNNLEQEIAQLQNAWHRTFHDDVRYLEKRIQQGLGEHWGVINYDSRCLNIGVIDMGKTTPENCEYFFGQSIEIRYERNPFGSGKETYQANCGTCGSFNMEGGDQVGERALFYAGIGKLFSDKQLIGDIKSVMALSSQTLERYCDQMEKLQKELEYPTKQAETVVKNPKSSLKIR